MIDNIFIDKLFSENILIYTMIGVFVFGVLLKIILNIGYSRMIRGSTNMGSTKNKLLRKLKFKYETFYKLKINVNNVDAFVDKSISNHKVLGILLTSWEKFSGQLSFLCCLIGAFATILAMALEFDSLLILSVFSVGLFASGLLILFENLLNKNEKREIIKSNILDYMQNYLKNRLEQEEENPELLDEYKRYFLGVEDGNENVSSFVAATDADVQLKFEDIENMNSKLTFKEKLRKARVNRKRKKEQKKASKLFNKQAKKAAKVKVKENKRKRRVEAQRARKQEKLRKREEKLREEEIRKALRLEKQMSLENEKAKKSTTAELNKESLKNEIKQLRQLEARNKEEGSYNIEVEERLENNMEREPITIQEDKIIDKNVDKLESVLNEKDISNSKGYKKVEDINKYKIQGKNDNVSNNINYDPIGYESEIATTRESEPIDQEKVGQPDIEPSKTQKRSRLTKLSKQDEKIIKDVLREYLG